MTFEDETSMYIVLAKDDSITFMLGIANGYFHKRIV